jgi:hypothetical protein
VLRDILISGYIPRDRSILRAELRAGHRVLGRRFLINYIPSNTVGAELGVFTGLFSSLLAKEEKIARVSFVDPWWKAFGDHYPDWGVYTDFGRVSTRKAFDVARNRISRSALPNRFVEVASSYAWLKSQQDKSLDWVYLDSTHSYEGTKRELELLDRKINDTGMILGDDWCIDRMHPHHGVCRAVNEFCKHTNFEVALCGQHSQWILRRALTDPLALPLEWKDRGGDSGIA